MIISNQGFIDAILREKLLPESEVNTILKQSQQNHYQLLTYIIRVGALLSRDAYQLWADSLNITWIDLKETLFQIESFAKIPKQFAVDNNVIPVYQMGDVITVAMADPKNEKIVAQTEKIAKAKISPIFAPIEDIEDAIEIQSHSVEELEELSNGFDSLLHTSTKEIRKDELEKIGSSLAVIDFTKALLLLAIKEEASDIHIEPTETNIVVRYRIDGVLHERLKLSKDILSSLVSRIKIISGMNIVEKRRPQDGRITLELASKSIPFRVSTVPTVSGEKIVLRLIGQIKKRSVPRLEEIQLSKSMYTKVKNLVTSPSGAFFITGPTGSGKTTTLYSALQHINTSEINIMTIEDPVEYRLPGVNQIQVNYDIGLNFSTALRSFLRQDPDVMLIGEIRDLETAKIATEAALTGHLVLATMHTNDAIQAVTRLIDIGVEPFLVGPSLIGIVSQRLVRKICDRCKESYKPSKEVMDSHFIWDGKQEVTFYRGKGCPSCKHTGFRGRIGIHEMIMANEEIRKLVTSSAPADELYKAAKRGGYESLRYDGLKKVLRGLTTLEEVERATFAY